MTDDRKPTATGGFPRGARAAAPGDEGLLDASELSARGDGASADGVHVRGLFPGEQARVHIVARGRRASHARIVELTRAHPGRREPPCHHHHRSLSRSPGREPERQCDGCPLLEVDEAAQRQFKADRLARLGLPVDRVVPSPRALGYRWSSKRVVAGTTGQLRFGSRRRGSSAVASMQDCRVDHPAIVTALEQARSLASSHEIPPWSEDSVAGLRYAWARTNGQEVALALLGGPDLVDRVRPIADALDRSSSVAVAIQTDVGNAIRGQPALVLRGEPLRVDFGTGPVGLGPLAFLQPNPELIALAYDDLIRTPDGAAIQVAAGARAWDLYAGSGAIGARLRRQGFSVESCESDPEGAATLGVEACEVREFVAAHASSPPALVVANPPRAGLGDAARELNRLGCDRVHLMSCNPESLVRDLSALTRFEIVAARAYDSLPQTAHVEVVVWLRSRDATR